jgi:hypothetical protein
MGVVVGVADRTADHGALSPKSAEPGPRRRTPAGPAKTGPGENRGAYRSGVYLARGQNQGDELAAAFPH